MLIKGTFKSEFADPVKFKKDISKCYISNFFVAELRSYYTEKERATYIKKQAHNKYIKSCVSGDSNICPKTLANYNLIPDMQKFSVFTSSNILGNIKFYHFYKNDKRPWRVIDRKRTLPKSRVNPSSGRARGETKIRKTNLNIDKIESIQDQDNVNQKQILIERQNHGCQFGIDLKSKKLQLDLKKEQLKSDYRQVHSGLIEEALLRLRPSRPRDYSKLHVNLDESPPSMKHSKDIAEHDDLDELLETGFEASDSNIDCGMSRSGNTQGVPNAHFSSSPNKFDDLIDDDECQGGSYLDSAESDDENTAEKNLSKDIDEPKRMSKVTSGSKEKEMTGGLLGITEYDSDDEEYMPSRKAFSFVESNLDKFNILNFIENHENNLGNA